MPQTRQNGAVVPIGSDPYALTQDLAALADSLNVETIVTNQAHRDRLTPHEGMRVVRLDLNGITETYINGDWVGSGATNVVTFGSGWTPITTDGHRPRLYRSGGIVFLVGGVTQNTGGSISNILTIPVAFRPSTTASMFVGSGVTSGGRSFQLILSNGVLSIPPGYLSGDFTIGNALPVLSSWPLY